MKGEKASISPCVSWPVDSWQLLTSYYHGEWDNRSSALSIMFCKWHGCVHKVAFSRIGNFQFYESKLEFSATAMLGGKF